MRGDIVVDLHDPLTGLTLMPAEAAIPGWREAVRTHFLAMERVGAAVLQSVARGLGLSGDDFAGAFIGGACLPSCTTNTLAPFTSAAAAAGRGGYRNRRMPLHASIARCRRTANGSPSRSSTSRGLTARSRLTDAAAFVPFIYGDYVWSSLPRLQRLFGDRTNR